MDYAVWEQYDVWPQFVEHVCADGGFANRAAAKEFCESVRARHQMVKYLRSRGVDLSKIPPPKYPRLASGDELRDMQELGEAQQQIEWKRRMNAIMNMQAPPAFVSKKEKEEQARRAA